MADKISIHPTLLAAIEKALEKQAVNQWREIAEQTRDHVTAALNLPADSDILHGIRESHMAFGAACAFNAANELQAAVERADELEQTFEAINDAQQRAINRWQASHPGNDRVWPDGCELIVWLLENQKEHTP